MLSVMTFQRCFNCSVRRVVYRYRPTEEKSLKLVAILNQQKFKLSRVLHTLSDDAHIDAAMVFQHLSLGQDKFFADGQMGQVRANSEGIVS